MSSFFSYCRTQNSRNGSPISFTPWFSYLHFQVGWKKINRQFSKEGIQVDNKHMKRWSVSAIREIQIKTTAPKSPVWAASFGRQHYYPKETSKLIWGNLPASTSRTPKGVSSSRCNSRTCVPPLGWIPWYTEKDFGIVVAMHSGKQTHSEGQCR